MSGVDDSRRSVEVRLLQLHLPRIHRPSIKKIVRKWSLMRSQARQCWPGAGHSQTSVLTSHCSHISGFFCTLCLYLCTFIPPQTTLILPILHFPEYPIKSLLPPSNVVPQHHAMSHTHPTGSEPVSLKSALESLFLWLFLGPWGWEFPVTAWVGSYLSLGYWDSLLCHFAQGHSNTVHTYRFTCFFCRLLLPLSSCAAQEEQSRSS